MRHTFFKKLKATKDSGLVPLDELPPILTTKRNRNISPAFESAHRSAPEATNKKFNSLMKLNQKLSHLNHLTRHETTGNDLAERSSRMDDMIAKNQGESKREKKVKIEFNLKSGKSKDISERLGSGLNYNQNFLVLQRKRDPFLERSEKVVNKWQQSFEYSTRDQKEQPSFLIKDSFHKRPTFREEKSTMQNSNNTTAIQDLDLVEKVKLNQISKRYIFQPNVPANTLSNFSRVMHSGMRYVDSRQRDPIVWRPKPVLMDFISKSNPQFNQRRKNCSSNRFMFLPWVKRPSKTQITESFIDQGL